MFLALREHLFAWICVSLFAPVSAVVHNEDAVWRNEEI